MKAFLHAYDHVNLGDDLFIRKITARYSHVKFYMYSTAANAQIYSDIKNLAVIDKDSKKFKMMQRLRPSLVANYLDKLKKQCDAVIYIGGSIFMEYPTWENIVAWWEFQSGQYPFYVIGANFGPYQTEEYKNKMGTQFAKLKDICFRDKYSYELFSNNKNSRLAPDILFSLAKKIIKDKKREIIIAPIECESREDICDKKEEYLRHLAKAADKYASMGYAVNIVPFCVDEGDERVAIDLSEMIKSEVRIISYNGKNHLEILNLFESAEVVLASRFHAAVIGLSYGCRILPIVYSNKTVNMLEDIGYLGNICDIRKEETYKYILDDNEAVAVSEELIKELSIKSEEHFRLLDKLFTRRGEKSR